MPPFHRILPASRRNFQVDDQLLRLSRGCIPSTPAKPTWVTLRIPPILICDKLLEGPTVQATIDFLYRDKNRFDRSASVAYKPGPRQMKALSPKSLRHNSETVNLSLDVISSVLTILISSTYSL
jgi:hypothetical protein